MAIIEGTFEKSSSLRVAIVIARFNDLITSKLLSGCLDCLSRHGIDVSESSKQLDIAWVPGSFELPIISQQLARTGKYEVLITLGAVIRGDTPHFEYVAQGCINGMVQVSLQTGIPITNGVLTVDSIEQALQRSNFDKGNKGAEAAITALEMAHLLNEQVN